MMSKTHICYGMMATLTFMNMRLGADIKELIPGAILGSCIPDIDTQKSWVSQSIPLIDDKLRDIGILKHRGITHGIVRSKKGKANYIGILLISFIFYILFSFYSNDLMIGIILGYFSHIILDIFAELIGITCKVDKKMYNVGWIINTFLIINYIVGLDILYFILINILSNKNGIYYFIGIIIFSITIIIIIFKYLKSEVKSKKVKNVKSARKNIKSKGKIIK